MYGSPAMNKDLNLPFQLSPYRQGKEEGPQICSGMLRYRSAPSAVLGEVCEELLPQRASGAEAEDMFPRFAAPDARDYLSEKQSGSGSASHGGGGGAGFTAAPSAAAPHVFFQWHQPPAQEEEQHQHHQQMQNLSSGGGGSSLLRQGSSPEGLFANLNADGVAGYGAARAMGSGMPGFALRQGPLMSQISEIGAESMPEGSVEEGGGARRFLAGYPVASWDDSVSLFDGFSKRIRDPSEVQNGDIRSHHHPPAGLAHHLSLPKSAVDMAAMERYLQFQDAVPCKVRAKRGCATHPRSIAERVRRTRISERIKKLQELVPNMDKQTNTADMLDLAVDYIKDLQRQAKALSDSRANCACYSRHQQ